MGQMGQARAGQGTGRAGHRLGRVVWDILGQSVAVLDQPASQLTNDRC